MTAAADRPSQSILQRARDSLRVRDWVAAEQLYRDAIDTERTGLAYVELAELLGARERYGEALRQLTAAQDAVAKSDDAHLTARLHHNFAAVYRALGQRELATRFQQRALMAQPDVGPEELLAHANDALQADRLELAERLLETAFELVEPAEQPELAAELLGTLGLTRGLRREPRAGLRLVLAALRLHRDAGDVVGEICDLINLCALCEARDWLQTAERCAELALSAAQTADLPHSTERASQIRDRLRELRRFGAVVPGQN